MRRSLLLIAAAFAAGVGVGYVLQPRAADRAPERGAPAAETRPAPAGGTTAVADPSTESVPVPEIPAGHGRILGHARGTDGAPLADVLVVATPYRDIAQKRAKGAAAPADPDLLEVGRTAMSSARWQREARRTARTGSDGAYAITGVAAMKWRVEAYKDGYQLEATPPGRNYVDPGATCDFVGSAIVRIDVDVRLADGRQPARAQILAEQRTGSSRATVSELWLPAEPWIELKSETYELRATATDAKSEPQTVTVAADSMSALRFDLKSRPGLRVRVVPPEGFEPTASEVFALRFTGDRPPGTDRLQREGMRNNTHDQRAEWRDLTPGSYLVGAARRVSVVVTGVVTLREATEDCELRLPAPDPREHVIARARGPDGTYLRDVTYALVSRSGQRVRHRGVQVARRSDGAGYLQRPAEGDLEAGERLFVLAYELSLGFDRPAYLEVTLAAYATLAGGLGLRLAPRGDQSRGYQRVGEEGRMRFGPVQPGAFDIVVTAIVDSESGLTAATVPIDLGPGERTISIDVPVLHSLAVRWPGGRGQRVVRLEHKGGRDPAILRTIREEVTTFERLPAGRYEIKATEGEVETVVQVDVPGRAEVALR
jgi:hypothetical protein